MPLLTAKLLSSSQKYASSNLFSLMIEHYAQKTQIIMKLNSETVNTRDIPWTFDFLQKNLPTVLASTCFNDEKIPFSIEVTRTELGHLFEHILLEYLCQEKLLRGFDEAVFSGRTNWNWEKEPVGLFHILINMHQADIDLFPGALEKSITLLERMILLPQNDFYSFDRLNRLASE